MTSDSERFELTREWLRKASGDLTIMRRSLQPPPVYDSAAFHAQQAIEKSLKGFLLWHQIPFRKTHNLEELVLQCEELDQDFGTFRDESRRITVYAIQTRYPDRVIETDPEIANRCVESADRICAFVRSRLPEEV